MAKINKHLLPIKAHFFFFMAAMGPILPQITVFGKQIGIEPEIMGFITSVLPILYVLAKPTIGFLADFFSNFRKFIFILMILIMTLSFAGFYFVPPIKQHSINTTDFELKNSAIFLPNLNECGPKNNFHDESLCTTMRKMKCNVTYNFTQFKFELFITKSNNSNIYQLCTTNYTNYFKNNINVNITSDCNYDDEFRKSNCLYKTTTFWIFVILMCLGTIGFNVTNSITDAICFDVLGESEEMNYGAQRVWGTIGFGVAALIAGIAVNMSTTETMKSFTPALIIMLIFSGFDILSTSKLKLPKFSTTESLSKEVWGLLKQPSIVVFLIFATLAGVIDSFIIYFLFWYLEEVAESTGYMESIKLIEGCVVAAECLGGEIPMFLLSGKILKKIGYVHCLSLCFFTYFIRLLLISLITNPWWLVVIEFFMQGCTYALCYTCIVAYASAIAPQGTSATVQGLVAGMDDGLGYAIGSLIGGQAYKYLGGARTFQSFAGLSLITCVAHIILRPASKHKIQNNSKQGYVITKHEIITFNENLHENLNT